MEACAGRPNYHDVNTKFVRFEVRMIQVIHGSIFDAKCDLLLVPCNSGGGVTQWVYTNLREHSLPTRVGRIPYGKVHFRESHYEFASTIGYAASVDVETATSDATALRRIAEDVIRYSRANQITVVNLPLLGSGAGQMTPIQSFESLAAVFTTADDIVFNVYCFTREVYQNIVATAQRLPTSQEGPRHPRVFISYTGNDKQNAAWVKDLARALRAHGVDARIDVFHLKPGFDLPQWMTNEVILADKVLLVCDRYYMEKADFKKGGVGWETMIIQGDMLSQGDNKHKYVAIIREDEAENALPIYMKSKYAFHWGKSPKIDPERLRELVYCVFDCDIEPELGAVPDYVRAKVRVAAPANQQPQSRTRGARRST